MSSESEALPASDSEETPEPAVGPSTLFPGYIRGLGGFWAAIEAIETARREAKLPSINPTNYRIVLGRPGGIPFSFPVTVIYKPESPKEKTLGPFRISR